MCLEGLLYSFKIVWIAEHVIPLLTSYPLAAMSPCHLLPLQAGEGSTVLPYQSHLSHREVAFTLYHANNRQPQPPWRSNLTLFFNFFTCITHTSQYPSHLGGLLYSSKATSLALHPSMRASDLGLLARLLLPHNFSWSYRSSPPLIPSACISCPTLLDLLFLRFNLCTPIAFWLPF